MGEVCDLLPEELNWKKTAIKLSSVIELGLDIATSFLAECSAVVAGLAMAAHMVLEKEDNGTLGDPARCRHSEVQSIDLTAVTINCYGDVGVTEAKKKRESLAVHLNEKLFRRSNEIPSKVVNFVMQRNGAVVGGALDCGLLAQQLAFSFHGSYLFGDTFLAWSNALLYEDLLMKISSEACIWASYSVPPIWKRRFWRYKHLCLKLKRLTQEIIQHFSQRDRDSHTEAMIIRRETPTKSEVSPSDWMVDDVLLGELDENLNLKEETCGDIMGLMFHGCLTTAGLISNILTRLVTHPEMQDKIHSEIIMVRQRSNESEMHDFRSMNFLLATIFESARLLPARPLLQRCSLKHDLHLDAGIIVPAGAILVVPVQLVQMDDSRWGGDAPQFNPRRFLSKAEEVVNLGEGPLMLKDPNTNASFLPFGSGARACVGQKYVIAGIARLFACLLQQYEVYTPELHYFSALPWLGFLIRVQAGSSPSEPKPTMNNCILHLLPSPNIILVKRNS
ncbi:hypothetical protein GIB67_035869 [Kingdonia uniflora]|uniref:Cytochrome P450 n=1 Tax=Kingdonia uniflora TaxID=39325 RepID=A0A7J7NUZ7_9MAGN|nr:hypothetical protein GIB67_035869 [Kingdonia uniflora]